MTSNLLLRLVEQQLKSYEGAITVHELWDNGTDLTKIIQKPNLYNHKIKL
jgi:hypothetical protein